MLSSANYCYLRLSRNPLTRDAPATPRKSVKDMVQQYEDNIISPPPEFRDDYKPIPAPRTKKPLQAPIPTPRTKKPVPEKRTIISQVEKALKVTPNHLMWN